MCWGKLLDLSSREDIILWLPYQPTEENKIIDLSYAHFFPNLHNTFLQHYLTLNSPRRVGVDKGFEHTVKMLWKRIDIFNNSIKKQPFYTISRWQHIRFRWREWISNRHDNRYHHIWYREWLKCHIPTRFVHFLLILKFG